MKGRRANAGVRPLDLECNELDAPLQGCDCKPPSLPSKTRSKSLVTTGLLAGPLSSPKVPSQKEKLYNLEGIDEQSLNYPFKLVQQQSVDMKDLESWHETHRPPKSIRTMQIPFRSGTTTGKDPVTVFQDIHRALIEQKEKMTTGNLEFKRSSDYYIFECVYIESDTRENQSNAQNVAVEVQFEMEVCKVWGWGSLHGIQTKRVFGDPLVYQRVLGQILNSLNYTRI
jgi:hypothetical protein